MLLTDAAVSIAAGPSLDAVPLQAVLTMPVLRRAAAIVILPISLAAGVVIPAAQFIGAARLFEVALSIGPALPIGAEPCVIAVRMSPPVVADAAGDVTNRTRAGG